MIRKISLYKGFLCAPRASQNVKFNRSLGRKNIENSKKNRCLLTDSRFILGSNKICEEVLQFFQKSAPKGREQCSLTFPKGEARAPSAPPGYGPALGPEDLQILQYTNYKKQNYKHWNITNIYFSVKAFNF